MAEEEGGDALVESAEAAGGVVSGVNRVGTEVQAYQGSVRERAIRCGRASACTGECVSR